MIYVFFFVILSTLVIPTLAVVTSEVDGSFEVINLNDAEELSFIANLQMDLPERNSTNKKILYYTSERGDSNVYTAEFVQGGGPETFLASGNSTFKSYNLPPFMTFDIAGPNVVGPVFTAPPYGIQNVATNGNTVSASITNYPGYNFVSVLVDSNVHGAGNQAYVYLAGWNPSLANNSFVVGRTNVDVGSSAPLYPIGLDDVIYLLTGSCYDLYDEKKHPRMYLADGYLIVVITGKCAYFARIKLPESDVTPFNSSAVDFLDPNAGVSYVSFAAFDFSTSIIYYTVKNFNAPDALVYMFDTKNWGQQPQKLVVLEDLERDTDLIIVFANSSTTKWIVIIGSGSDRVERYTISGNTLVDKASTLLEDEINTVYSALYYDPYIYFSTFEPDAKIARLHINNFCDLWCSSNGYCVDESCSCKRGYVYDAVEGCVAAPSSEPMVDARVTGLAVLSGIAIVAAIIGWIMWYRSKSSYEQIK